MRDAEAQWWEAQWRAELKAHTDLKIAVIEGRGYEHLIAMAQAEVEAARRARGVS